MSKKNTLSVPHTKYKDKCDKNVKVTKVARHIR